MTTMSGRRFLPFLLLSIVLLVCLVPGPPAEAQRGITPDLYRRQMNRALDRIIADAGRPSGRLWFGVHFFFAHEAFIQHTPLDALKKGVDAFKDAGVHRIDMNVGQFPWRERNREVIEKYDALVAHVRSRGLQLGFNPQYSPVYHTVGGMDEWTRVAHAFYAEIAARYQPDNFVVVHEPTTMATRMRASVSTAEWKAFAAAAAKIVKSKSPRTRIGAGGLHNEKEYFEAFAELPEIDVLTLDVYRLVGLSTFREMIQIARRAGKPVYIEETWRPPYASIRPGMSIDQIAAASIGDGQFQEIDVKWLRAFTLWALSERLEGVTPGWTQPFFKYVDGASGLDPAYHREVVQAILDGQRTGTYRAFAGLIETYGRR